MELIEFGAFSDRHRAELEGNETDPWGAGHIALRFQPKQRHVGLRDEDGTLVACAGITVAEAQVNAERFQVLGIGGVIVRASFRGRGLARTVVEAALERGRALGPPFALLFCLEDRAGLYRRLDFTEVDGDVLVRQDTGYEVMPLRTMWRALHPEAAWPAGQLVLHSPPF